MASELVERLAKKRHAKCYIKDASRWEDAVDEVRFYLNAIADEIPNVSNPLSLVDFARWLRALAREE